MKVLVTGATGYVGGRLVPRLLDAGHEVRVLVRSAARIRGRPWANRVDIAVGDLLNRDSLKQAFDGVEIGYYLVHSMQAGADFEARDRQAARNYAVAASGIQKTIYLGGLQPPDESASSRHLRSRAEVGRILRENLPVTEFRAGPIIGSGSASFEMLRYLCERLPVMITPKWIFNEIQPIAIRDVLAYLMAALELAPLGVVDIGSDRVSFKRMMELFADERELRRKVFPVPLLAPKLAALWVGLVTPISNSMAVPIIEGIVQSLLADTEKAKRHFSAIRPVPVKEALRLALQASGNFRTETHWSDALRARKESPVLKDEEGMIREIRAIHVDAPPETVFGEALSLGGDRGWLEWEWAWKVRGALDRWVGGPGLRRGRRNPREAFPGDAIDFWRVEVLDPPRLLRLHAEMKVPGSAWIEWQVEPEKNGSRLVQTAYFLPKGLGGFTYWYALYPIHGAIFGSLVRAIAREAESRPRELAA